MVEPPQGFGALRRAALLAALVAPLAASAQETSPWRADPLFQRIASRLAGVAAVDNHTHLLETGPFDPGLDSMMPLGLRSAYPPYTEVLASRFGAAVVDGDIAAAHRRGLAIREAMLARWGVPGYWRDHLDAAGVARALVNQDQRDGTDGERLLWVPYATNLIYPLPADHLITRSPQHATDIGKIQQQLRAFLKEDGRDALPATLADYDTFVESTLTRWRAQGAVAVKFYDAYLRTLDFEDVAEARAAELYLRGRTTPLAREEYLALQDHLVRRIILAAGPHGLVVHIHSSHGVPPFLQTRESDVRLLEPILTDVRYFGTQIVLIHGGAPFIEHAAYLALKPHVWYDMSALPFLYPVPDLAAALRKVLTFAPEKLLFSTDVGAYPAVPVGADLQHLALVAVSREALALALTGLVRDGVLDIEAAVRLGEAALAGNARRLYGWSH